MRWSIYLFNFNIETNGYNKDYYKTDSKDCYKSWQKVKKKLKQNKIKQKQNKCFHKTTQNF